MSLRERPWVAQAACLDGDVELFFSPDGHEQAKALRVCAGCPVRVPCLAYALEHGEEYGVWGGRTEGELRRLRRHLSGGIGG